MQKNETLLTPIYQYIFSNLDAYTRLDVSSSVSRIEAFLSHLAEGVQNCTDAGNEIIESSVELLTLYGTSQSEAKEYWDTEMGILQRKVCSNCFLCKGCKKYFWKELGDYLFDIPNEERAEKYYIPVRRIPHQISKHLEPSTQAAELYYKNSRKRNSLKFQDKLMFLKGMSSSTPSVLNSVFDTGEFTGGGFYFRWDGLGVVIDPGYHFVENLHHYGLSVFDIDVVIVTHGHIDHNNDIRLINDIHDSTVGCSNHRAHTISWYMDEISYEIAVLLQKNAMGFWKENNKLFCVDLQNKSLKNSSGCVDNLIDHITLKEDTLKFRVFPTTHIQNSETRDYLPLSFGCSFVCQREGVKTILSYTSDTRYFQELPDMIKDADILIANISAIYEDDYMRIKEKNTHLGYYGCYELVKECFKRYGTYPSYYFISEFWNSKSDIRFDIAKQMQEELGKEIENTVRIVPAEVGMVLDIAKKSLKCSQCGRYSDTFKIRRPFGLGDKVEAICRDCSY